MISQSSIRTEFVLSVNGILLMRKLNQLNCQIVFVCVCSRSLSSQSLAFKYKCKCKVFQPITNNKS